MGLDRTARGGLPPRFRPAWRAPARGGSPSALRLRRQIQMKSAAVVALALLESAQAFQAPALKAARSVSKVSMFSEGDIGVLPPLGVYDPLGLIETRNMFRYGARRLRLPQLAAPPSRGAAARRAPAAPRPMPLQLP